jgi:hypothetical protein
MVYMKRRTVVVLVVLAVAVAAVIMCRRRRVSCGHHLVLPGSSCSVEGSKLGELRTKLDRTLTSPLLAGSTTLARIRQRWSGILREASDGRVPAYTENKRSISVCLRSGSTDALFFVVLHELAHVASTSYGHTDEFWQHFRLLVDAARSVGVYVVHDPTAKVCGHALGDEPPRQIM